MEGSLPGPFASSPQPAGPLPATIHVSPAQQLAQLPVAALLAFIPRLRTTYRVLNNHARTPVATGRTHYRLRLGAGQTLYISDNLLDVVRLIDGRRNVQALSDALAEQQGRPVHPAEIIYLLRHQLVPGGLVELALPLALPEPKPSKPPAAHVQQAPVPHSASTAMERPTPQATQSVVSRPPRTTTRPLDAPALVQWIPPGRRAERLRATRHPPLLARSSRRASYMNLIATFLVILAAGAAFAFAHAGFSHASIPSVDLGTFFGGPTPTATIVVHQGTPTATAPLPPIHYIAQYDDTLAKIAARFNVTVTALLLVNNMKSPDELHYGQVLIIPTVYHPGANPSSLAYPIFYVVQEGDSISSIAQFFGSTADTLIQFNHITNPALIQPGDSLVIPSRTQPEG
jgi:LysM repeat protein